MKKITRRIASAITLVALSLTPAVVHAQSSSGVIDVGSGATSTTASTSSTDAGKGAGVPNTGVAPKNHIVQNGAVFMGGSVLGAAIGLGIITLKKNASRSGRTS